MHGRVKTRTTAEQKEIAKQEKCKKAKAHQTAMKIVIDKRGSCSYDQEALDVTANLLTGNPDIISLWNYRREIFLNLKNEEDLESYQQLLEKDLNLTEQCLRANPKSYGSWHHRIWILDNLPKPNWERELMLCTKYLQLDERNFHCWDYRRIITQRSNIPDVSEYNYTLEKIETNFSNYSAWHLRSKLLPRIFPDPENKFPIDESKHREELVLVENAAFTDPNDQSAWFYQRWLLDLTEPKISFVFVEAKEKEVFVVTSKSLRLNGEFKFGVGVRVEINGETPKGLWSSCGGQVQSCIWRFKPDTKIQSTDAISIMLEENGVVYSHLQLQLFKSFTNKPNFLPVFSQSLMETLTNQLSSCEQLLELEPDSKWTLLTSIFLMLSIDCDKHKDHILSGLDKLRSIDPLREGYYLDLRSRILAEWAIVAQFGSSDRFLLSNENLTCLYHTQYLCNFQNIDLSNNALQSGSLGNLILLLECKNLNLSNNRIDSLKEFPVLPKLQNLMLDGNLIEEVDPEFLSKVKSLTSLSLSNNPVTRKNDGIEELACRLGNVNLCLSGS